MCRGFFLKSLILVLAFIGYPADSGLAFFRQAVVTQAKTLGQGSSVVAVESEEMEEQGEALDESFSWGFSLPKIELAPVNTIIVKNLFVFPQDSNQLHFLNIPPPSSARA